MHYKRREMCSNEEFEKYKIKLKEDVIKKVDYFTQYERTGNIKDLFLAEDTEEYYRELEIQKLFQEGINAYKEKFKIIQNNSKIEKTSL